MTSRQSPWRKVLVWSGLVVAAAVVVVAGIYAVFWPLSDLIARHDVGAITGPQRAVALQAARDAARGRLVAIGAGLFALGALVYTARNFGLSRSAQVTDRYTKAIEQLGSDKIDVRLGAVYALERIARDSAFDHPTVMEVLAAFIRYHSQEQWPPAEPGAEPPRRSTRPDIQAAATVIGRRTVRHGSQPINLQLADLTRATLTGARLSGANLLGAKFTDADLTGADLSSAVLPSADLSKATLTDANLTDANLTRTNLSSADLGFNLAAYFDRVLPGGYHDPAPGTGVKLIRAKFWQANLTDAALSNADLTDARFDYTNLTRAHLNRAVLTRARLHDTDLTEADLTDAILTGATLDRANLTGADFTGANLTAADLSSTDPTGANFTDADLTDAIWPPRVAPDGWRREPLSRLLKPTQTDSGSAATD